MNFFYRSLAHAAGLQEADAGQTIKVNVDLAIAHDGTCPKLLKQWESDDKVFDGRRVMVTVDHAFPAPSTTDRQFQRELAEFATEQGIALYNHGEGVLHQVVAEKAALWPGMIIAGADGHVATSGAYGALAFALAPEGLHPVLTSGKLELKVPEVITFDLVGDLKAGTMPRDIALYLLGNFHAQIKGKAVALQGEFLAHLSPAGKMTICNILPEGGAVTAFFVPAGDEDESIDHIIDVDGIEPMVALPPEPTSVKPVRELAGTPITVAIVGG
ncbi:MAG TPA: aconitase family protein, partial [Verrucomicrobiae bacterium]|nr:aconitase family protein [Verrucomicrobiae bacterium]